MAKRSKETNAKIESARKALSLLMDAQRNVDDAKFLINSTGMEPFYFRIWDHGHSVEDAQSELKQILTELRTNG